MVFVINFIFSLFGPKTEEGTEEYAEIWNGKLCN
jgi:hypothetical protein